MKAYRLGRTAFSRYLTPRLAQCSTGAAATFSTFTYVQNTWTKERQTSANRGACLIVGNTRPTYVGVTLQHVSMNCMISKLQTRRAKKAKQTSRGTACSHARAHIICTQVHWERLPWKRVFDCRNLPRTKTITLLLEAQRAKPATSHRCPYQPQLPTSNGATFHYEE